MTSAGTDRAAAAGDARRRECWWWTAGADLGGPRLQRFPVLSASRRLPGAERFARVSVAADRPARGWNRTRRGIPDQGPLGGLTWEALVHPGRKMRTGERIIISEELTVEILARGEHGERTVRSVRMAI